MDVKALNLKESPEVALTASTCLWLLLSEGNPAHWPAFLQRTDWSMRGALTRYCQSPADSGMPTFIPTLGRLPSPMIIIQKSANQAELEKAVRSMENLGFRQTVLWLENEDARSSTEKWLEEQKSSIMEEVLFVQA